MVSSAARLRSHNGRTSLLRCLFLSQPLKLLSHRLISEVRMMRGEYSVRRKLIGEGRSHKRSCRFFSSAKRDFDFKPFIPWIHYSINQSGCIFRVNLLTHCRVLSCVLNAHTTVTAVVLGYDVMCIIPMCNVHALHGMRATPRTRMHVGS